MSLKKYQQKRDFKKTPEPKGKVSRQYHYLFVIQKHAASHLHYDFRLELNGVLKSWAVPKGPCADPLVKRLAMHVEDHPVEYGFFEGIIPKGEYGGGTVMLWDKGVWEPLDPNPLLAYTKGHLRFILHAEKLKGRWDLIRFKDENHWFLIKYQDEYSQPLACYDITEEQPNSVLSNQSLEEISQHYKKVWSSTKKKHKRMTSPRTVPVPEINLPEEVLIAPFPAFIPPQLATLVSKPPSGTNWIHEIKFDGYRILAFISANNIILKSRNNKDWTAYFPSIVMELEQLQLKPSVLDGEIVVLNEEGKSDFQLLQNSIKAKQHTPYIYYVFDILYYDQYDVIPLTLLQRKDLLSALLKKRSEWVRFSDFIQEDGKEVFEHACQLSLEGIISKEVHSPYVARRSKHWLKIKCIKRQEFVIGGYTLPKGGRSSFGALLLGVYDNHNNLIFSGKVGTGFTNTSLKKIFGQLQTITQPQNPFRAPPPESAHAKWVKPVLVAEIEFSEWTAEGHLRHPSFKGLRLDKDAKHVKKEWTTPLPKAGAVMTPKNKTTKKQTATTISHPDKVLYPEDHITKEDLLNYYDKVHEFILPYLKKRFLTLLRCPENYQHCFYQRHLGPTTAKGLHTLSIESKGDHEEYIYLDNKTGLLALVQMGVLEIHSWSSRIETLEYPDYLTFDLDPAPDVAWKEVVEAAVDVKENLAEYQLESFVKTTGGKGLHVVIPIQPEYDWDVIKNFTHVFARFMEQRKPGQYISNMSKAKRSGKIFIDYLRNQHSATAIAVYSTRARLHAPVSTPLHWDELSADKRDNEYTIKTVIPRLEAQKKDPWERFFKVKQSLNLDKI